MSVGANLAIILTIFVVSFTIGWGVYFLSLVKRQNSPNCTSMIRMLSFDGRMGNFGGLNRDTMQSLQMMLHACNPYANIYQTAMKRFQGGAVELNLRLVNDRRTNLRHYNAPIVDKVGALMVGDDVDEVNTRDIVVRSINGYF
jgi:hypothetical protein